MNGINPTGWVPIFLHSALAMLIVGTSTAVQAANPVVAFDLAPTIACRELPSDDSLPKRPDEKLIEATFAISVRMKDGSAKDLRELVVEINSPDRRLRVMDYTPGTTLESQYEGPIQISTTKEKSHNFGIGLGGRVSVPQPTFGLLASPSANLGIKNRKAVTETVKKKPSKEPLVIAGTQNHGYGVFFEIKPSPQTSLEGQKEFTCRFLVPNDWRGDWVQVSCRATGVHRNYFLKSEKPSGSTKLFVGLYLVGDSPARSAARRLANAQGINLGTNRQTIDAIGPAQGVSSIADKSARKRHVTAKPITKNVAQSVPDEAE